MVNKLKSLLEDIKSLRRDIAAETRDQISKKDLRARAEALGTRWFSEAGLLDDRWGMSPETLQGYNEGFSRLIRLSGPNNAKGSYLSVLDALKANFRDDLIISVQTRAEVPFKPSLLEEMLKDLPNPEENAYLKEAIECTKYALFRGAAILGWCAAIDRIHKCIEKTGFVRFNMISVRMAGETKGRFKKFSSPQSVNSLSELREVFDTVVLWVVEGMGLVDVNQHTRLRSCFELRSQCAHPGEAPITQYNLLSFFSDINEIVFKNPKFAL
jgi:hypothetical protein